MTDLYLLAFWLLLLAALATSWRAGGPGDRRMIVAIVAAALGSAVVYSVLDMRHALLAVFAVDLLLLLVVGNYALKCSKHWPLWFVGFHGTSVLFQLFALALPDDATIPAWRMAGFWSLPAIMAMTAGLLLDQSAESSA